MTNLVYQQTANELRRRITAGDYDETTGLPTEAELCESLGVSRSSLRRGLDLLRHEGLVVSRQGSGWSVAPTLVRSRLGVRGAGESTIDVASEPELVGHQLLPPPEAVAGVLGAEDNEAVLVVERTSALQETVVHRSETWFSPTISEAIDHGLAAQRPPALLLDELGYEIERFDQYVEAVLSNDRDEELVGLPPGSAVLQVVRTAFDADGAALFQSIHRHPGAATRVEIDLPTSNNPRAGTVSLTPEA